jgi:hypothetical protein
MRVDAEITEAPPPAPAIVRYDVIVRRCRASVDSTETSANNCSGDSLAPKSAPLRMLPAARHEPHASVTAADMQIKKTQLQQENGDQNA